MKNLKCLFFLLFFPILQNAQIPEVDWGPSYNEKAPNGKAYFGKHFLGYVGDSYYLVASTRKNRNLIQFNSQNEMVKTVPINLEYDGRKIFISELINTSSGHYLLSFDRKGKKHTTTVFSNKLEPNGTVSPEISHLFSYRSIVGKPAGKNLISTRNKDSDGFVLSADSSKVLFVSPQSLSWEFSKKKGNEIYHFALFDDQMKLQWEKNIEFPYVDTHLDVEQFIISNDGDIYVLGLAKAKEKRKNPYPEKDAVLIKITEKEVIEIDRLKIGEKYLAGGGYLHLQKDGTLFIFGAFTSKNVKSGGWEGLFLKKYNKEGKPIFSETYNWTTEIKELFEKRLALSFNSAFINFENQSITLALENRYNLYKEGKFFSGESNFIILPSFTFEGDLRWMTLVEKDFKSEGSSALSFLLGHKNDAIYLVFNDEKDRKERKALNAPKSLLLDYYFTDITKINSEGRIEFRETLFNSKDLKYYFHVPNSTFIKNGKLLIAGQGIKNLSPEFRFGTIILD